MTKGRPVKKASGPETPERSAGINPRAVRQYERGLRLYYQKKYPEAREKFLSLIESYPGERDIVERGRLFARSCEARMASASPNPRKVDDLYYHAVLKSNEQEYDEAIGFLEKALKLNPEDDRLVYLLSATCARKGDRDKALSFLRDAIRLKEINRTLAKHDPDFEEIREDRDFFAVLSGEEG